MKLTIIGCGNAFSYRNYNFSILLEENNRKMLIDCGQYTLLALKNQNIDFKSINDIYISHSHADHIGGLEQMALMRYDWIKRPQKSNEDAPVLIGNDLLLKNIWEHSLKGGLSTMEGFVSSLDTFFQVKKIKPNSTFMWQSWKCKLIQQIHIMSGSITMPSFGIFMTNEFSGTKVYFTTDSQHCSPSQMEVFYKDADTIFQDCDFNGYDSKERVSRFKTGVHANYAQLLGIPSANSIILSDDIKSKMYLGHYQDYISDNKDFYGNDCEWEEQVKKDGFIGLLKVGDVFNIG